jgi:N-acetylglucosamine-6-phosphate deacetylase
MSHAAQKTFYVRKERPDTIIDVGGNILRYAQQRSSLTLMAKRLAFSPGLIDIQINGAYDFDFSVYEGEDDKYIEGLDMVARRIVETGVTASAISVIFALISDVTNPFAAGYYRPSS